RPRDPAAHADEAPGRRLADRVSDAARRRHPAQPRLWPRDRDDLGPPGGRAALPPLLRRRRGGLPQPPRPAALGQGPLARPARAARPLPALGPLPGRPRASRPGRPLPQRLPAQPAIGLTGPPPLSPPPHGRGELRGTAV